jgi:hypothetical protein
MRPSARTQEVRRNPSVRTFSIATLALLALATTSCTKWSHPAKGQREYNTDSTLCWRVADQTGETKYWPRYHVYEDCMADRGWDTN